jgi:hypothetical protein
LGLLSIETYSFNQLYGNFISYHLSLLINIAN